MTILIIRDIIVYVMLNASVKGVDGVMRKSLIKRMFCCVTSAVAAAALLSYMQQSSGIVTLASPESEDYEQRLADIEQEQKELDDKIAEAESRAGSEREKLEAVSEKLKSLEAEISETEKYSEKIIDEMVETDDELRVLTHELEEQEKAITEEVNAYGGRMRALYLAGGESYASIILTSDNFFDVLMRTELVKRVANHDRDTIDGLLEKLREIQDKKAAAEEKSRQLQEKTSEYSERREKLLKSKEEQDALLEKYSDSLEKLGLLSEELEGKSKELEEKHSEVSREAAEATTTITTTTTTTTSAAAPETTAEVTTTPKETAASATATKKTTAPPETTEETTSKTTKKTTEETKASSAETTTTTTATTTAPATTTTTTAASAPAQSSDAKSKLQIVIDYALSNVGGKYVWGGASYRATDCSGLTMLAYAQVGISIPHWTVTQAQCGTSVSYSELQPGDLVFFGNGSSYSGVYHAAMYIGNGRIVHAMNSQAGIVISDLARFSIYNPITFMKRIIT